MLPTMCMHTECFISWTHHKPFEPSYLLILCTQYILCLMTTTLQEVVKYQMPRTATQAPTIFLGSFTPRESHHPLTLACQASETRDRLLTSLGSTSHTAASLLCQAGLALRRAWDALPSRAATHTHSLNPFCNCCANYFSPHQGFVCVLTKVSQVW